MNFLTGIWLTMNYWSLVGVAMTMAVGFIVWKALTRPADQQSRDALQQTKLNYRQTVPPLRRLAISMLIFLFGFMASSMFVIAVYKMFN